MGQQGARRDVVARTALADFGAERLRVLCQAADGDSARNPLTNVFARLVQRWGSAPIGERPRYASFIADDQGPFEFSIALTADGPPEVQVYVEPLGEPPALLSNMQAGRMLLDSMAVELGAPLERLRQIEDLFFPSTPCGPFTIWIGASWIPGRPVRLKVYLNPHVRGDRPASTVVTTALDRLGFGHAWSMVREALSSRTDHLDDATLVSLDLAEAESARVKVYLRHHHARVDDIHQIALIAQDYHPTDTATFYAAVAGDDGPFSKRSVLTEFAFVEAGAHRPSSVTLEFPVGSYSANDEVARQRVSRCLASFGLPSQTYERAIHAFAGRPLEERSGIHAHITLRRIRGRPRVAVYLASEAYILDADERKGGHG